MRARVPHDDLVRTWNGLCCRPRYRSLFRCGWPSGRRASPRRQSSSDAWHLGCRDGCGLAELEVHRREWSSRQLLSTRGMALGILELLINSKPAPAGVSIRVLKTLIQPTTCARPRSALLSCHLLLVSP